MKVAPDLLGKRITRVFEDGSNAGGFITEVEAYCGKKDLACHASRGRTSRTEVMYGEGGFVYVYLIYGLYWMLNIVTGKKDDPQAVLIRSMENVKGPANIC